MFSLPVDGSLSVIRTSGGGVSGPERWIGGTETRDGIERSADALRAVLTDDLGHEFVGSDRSVPWTLKHSPRRYDLWMIDCIATEASLEEQETGSFVREGQS